MHERPDKPVGESAAGDRRRSERITTAVAVGTLVLTLATSLYAAISARQAERKADELTELLQGSDECRALREEILKLHEAHIPAEKIKNIYRNEPATAQFRAENPKTPNPMAFEEYSKNCGSVHRTVELITGAK
jgi:hypothetical protein